MAFAVFGNYILCAYQCICWPLFSARVSSLLEQGLIKEIGYGAMRSSKTMFGCMKGIVYPAIWNGVIEFRYWGPVCGNQHLATVDLVPI